MFFKNAKENDTPESSANKTLLVKTTRCPQNHPCPSVRVCPVGALKQSGFAAPKVDQDACIKCSKCVRYCPMGALVLE